MEKIIGPGQEHTRWGVGISRTVDCMESLEVQYRSYHEGAGGQGRRN